MSDHLRNTDRTAWLLLGLVTLTALSVVPDWPHRHLDDPSYWGLVGYGVVCVALLRGRNEPWASGTRNRRVIVAFLIGLPIVYVSNGLRFGGSDVELAVQLVGLGIWGTFAFLARRSDVALWSGCAGHAVWDALHFGRVGFIPDWFVVACVAVDAGLGAFVLLRLRARPP